MLGRESGVFNAFAVLGSDDEVDVKPVEKKAPAAAPAHQQRRPQSARPQAASGPAQPTASAEGYTETKGRSQGGRRPQGGAVISPQGGQPSHPRPISATGALGPRPRGPGQGRNRPMQTSESYRMNEAPEHGKRPFERRSATGRGREVGRQGDGKFNWGDDDQFAKNLTKAPGAAHEKVERLVHPPTPTAAAPEDPLAKEAPIVEGEAAATATTDEAGAAASAAAEEEEKDKTIDYATWKKQRDAQLAQFQLSGVKASGEIDPNQVLHRKMSDPEGEWVEDEDNTPSGGRVSKEKKKILGISDFLSGERVRYSFADRGDAPRGGRGGFRGGRGGAREGGERPPREGGERPPREGGERPPREGGEGFRGGRGGGFRGGRGGARGGNQGGQRGGRQGGPNFNLAAEEFPTLGK